MVPSWFDALSLRDWESGERDGVGNSEGGEGRGEGDGVAAGNKNLWGSRRYLKASCCLRFGCWRQQAAKEEKRLAARVLGPRHRLGAARASLFFIFLFSMLEINCMRPLCYWCATLPLAIRITLYLLGFAQRDRYSQSFPIVDTV